MQAILDTIQGLLNSVVPVLLALGVVYFVWGVVQYFLADAEEAKKKGRDHVVYGIIGLAVIVGLWGLVNLVVNTLNIGGAGANIPNLIPVTAVENGGNLCQIGFTNIQTSLGYLTCLIRDSIIPFIFAIAVVMFIWGAVKFFIINAGEEAKREQGKQFMIWGIIALAVMVSVWGLVRIVAETFVPNASILPGVQP